MSAIILNGKETAKKYEENLKKEVQYLKEKYGSVATLATIIVGDNVASKTYVKMKMNACDRLGIKSLKIELDDSATTQDLLVAIDRLNKDSEIDGILIQHPLPKHIDERRCFNAIDIKKDVDGVTSCGFGAMVMGENAYVSATPLGIIKLLEEYNIELEGKEAIVVGRSPILGKPIAMMLLNKNCTVTIAHSKTANLKDLIKKSDIVVACVGKAEFIKKEWIKKDAVVIDAGYNEGNVGDVELEGIEDIAYAYTPVPGGVGPMTIISLLTQTIDSFRKKMRK